MDEIYILDKCHKAKTVIIYGAGYYAQQMTFYLQGNGIELTGYCVSEVQENPQVYLGKPVWQVEDLNWNIKDLLVIIAVSKIHHHEIADLLEKKKIKNLLWVDDEFIRELENSKEQQRQRVLSWILLNEPYEKIESKNEEYEKKIESIRNNFSKVEIRMVRAFNLPQIIGGICHYADGGEADGQNFFLLYPSWHDDEEKFYEKKFMFPNRFVMRAFRGNYYELLCDNNLSFWKYFVKNYMDFFVDNSRMSLILEVKRRQVEHIKKGIYGCVGKQYYFLTKNEECIGSSFLQKQIPTEKYICIYARDSGYYIHGHHRELTPERKIMHSFRNSDINNFSKTCTYFREKNMYSVRIGSHVERECHIEGCLDYASKLHDPFLDIYLQAKCEFVIGDDSGALSFAALFSTPIVSVNVPIVTVHEWDPVQPGYFEQDLRIMTKMWDTKKQRYLTLREMISYEIDSMQDESIRPNMGNIYLLYAKNKIRPVMNTSQEILDVAIEMYERIKGTRVYDSLDNELQEKYMEILKEANCYKRRFGFPARMGARFLRENQWLLN